MLWKVFPRTVGESRADLELGLRLVHLLAGDRQPTDFALRKSREMTANAVHRTNAVRRISRLPARGRKVSAAFITGNSGASVRTLSVAPATELSWLGSGARASPSAAADQVLQRLPPTSRRCRPVIQAVADGDLRHFFPNLDDNFPSQSVITGLREIRAE